MTKWRRLLLSVVFNLILVSLFLPLPPASADHSNGEPCIDNMATIYPCKNVDLIAHLNLDEIGAADSTVKGNDIWGWVDPVTGKEYVIFGLTDGTSFIDISDKAHPVYLGKLPGHGGVSVWRDMKVYQNHVYIVGDIPTTNGLQVFDLTQLRDVVAPPIIFTDTFRHTGIGPGHNMWINEDAGTLYVMRTDICNGGIVTFDLTIPANPQMSGCFAEGDTPLSDAECVNYVGPDADYSGKELCFVGSDENMTVYDVSDKANVTLLADTGYAGIARAHQGTLTADQRYWIMTDVWDERDNGTNTRTYLFDMLDVDIPVYLGFYEHDNTSRDHNAYIIDHTMTQSNWMSGLRILDIANIPSTNWELTGYFDIEPDSDSIAVNGAWSHYPWWQDGYIAVSGVSNGLFILQYEPEGPTGVQVSSFAGKEEGMPALTWGILFLILLLARKAYVE